MPEIKVNKGAAEGPFNNLKSSTGDLDASQQKVNLSVSKLDFIDKIENIEDQYYQTLSHYQKLLQKVEADAWSKIEEYFEVDENISVKMGSRATGPQPIQN